MHKNQAPIYFNDDRYHAITMHADPLAEIPGSGPRGRILIGGTAFVDLEKAFDKVPPTGLETELGFAERLNLGKRSTVP